MISKKYGFGLETKFCRFENGVSVSDGASIEGYGSLFGKPDQGGDVVEKGAYAKSLQGLAQKGRAIKMLWQHEPAQPIGVWEDVREDEHGLYVKGRFLIEIAKGREAAALVEAGAIDGLSIGYRTLKATKDAKGLRRLTELELWEVSLVTFPMLSEARVGTKGEEPEADLLHDLAETINDARLMLACDTRRPF